MLVDNKADRKTTEDVLKYAAENTCNLRCYLKLLGCQCARTIFLNMLLRVSFNKIVIYVCLSIEKPLPVILAPSNFPESAEHYRVGARSTAKQELGVANYLCRVL